MNKALYNETKQLLKDFNTRWRGDVVTIGSAKESPKTIFDAHTFNAYHLARAANQLQDPVLLDDAELEFRRADELYWNHWFGTYEEARHEEIQQTVKAAINKLANHHNASSIQPLIQRMYAVSDPTAIQAQKNFDAGVEEGTHVSDAVLETIDDASKPFQVAAGLWSGKPPAGMDPNTFRLIQVGVYGGLVATALGFTYLYIRPFLPQRRQ